MFDHDKCAFHLARADAERIAAHKAASALTSVLHLRLADLHASYACNFATKQDATTAIAFGPPRARTHLASDHVHLEPIERAELVG